MTSAKLQRARLTGVIVPGVAADDPDPGCMARLLAEDAQVDPQVQPDLLGEMARLITPSNAPVPDYAAYLHFWNRVNAPDVVPIIDPNQQPKVIKRVDLAVTNTAGAVACCTVTLQRTSWMAKLEMKWDGTYEDVCVPGDWLDLTFQDPLSGEVVNKLGLLLDIGVVANLPAGVQLQVYDRVPVDQVLANANIPEDPSGIPHKYCWLCGPMAPTGVPQHAHLNPGVGGLGGGVAFASWAPSTEGEAWALGYRDLSTS